MSKQYVTVLKESLEKKIHVLDEIYRLCQLQTEAIDQEPADLEAFDRYMNDKDVCIEKINTLDEGFDTLYSRVDKELKENKASYAEEIAAMKDLISGIMEKSTAIQALEERNKKAVEAVLSKERKELGQGKRSLNVAMNYYRNMSNTNAIPPQYMDKKK